MADARRAAASEFRGRALLRGEASGTALVLDEPLSFWGGLDPETGVIVEERHPQRGASVGGRVVVMAAGRGSSSSSNVLAEALRLGTGPAAILLREPDEIVLVGALVVELLDGITMPIVVLGPAQYAGLRTGDEVSVDDSGTVRVRR
jgi:predicted aconitase with swiveling domain